MKRETKAAGLCHRDSGDFIRLESISINGLWVIACNTAFIKQNVDLATIRKADCIRLVCPGAVKIAALRGQGFSHIKAA